MLLSKVPISKNNQAYNGGAISLADNNLNSISDCIFENNAAQNSGGAINSVNATVDLFNSFSSIILPYLEVQSI